MPLTVELVAADRQVWSGDASLVAATTPEGGIGILPGHEPLLALLADGPVRIMAVEGDPVIAHVDGGFMSVDHDLITLVAEQVDVTAGMENGAAGS